MTEQTLDRGDPETLFRFQVGDPVEHRGIVVAPLFPRRDPVAGYLTLDEALARGVKITETEVDWTVPELVVDPLDEPCCSTTVKRSSARNRTASSMSACSSTRTRPSRSPCRASSRVVGARLAAFSSAARLERRPAGARRPSARGPRPSARRGAERGRGALHEKLSACRWTRRPGRAVTSSPVTGWRSWPSKRLPRPAGPVRRRPRARRALCLDVVSRPDAFAACGRRCGLATCWTRSNTSTRARCGPSVSLVRRRGVPAPASATVGRPRRRRPAARPRVLGAGLELDGELIQLSAFTIEADRRARGRITRPSRRSA